MYSLDQKEPRELVDLSKLPANTFPCWPVRATGQFKSLGSGCDFSHWIISKFSLRLLVSTIVLPPL